MKYVQIGILVALVIVAGLLYGVYRTQSPPPAPVAAVEPVTAPAPAPPMQAAPAEPTAETKPPVQVEPAEEPRQAAPARRRPSPAAPARKSNENAKQEVQTAAAASPAPVQAAPQTTPQQDPPAPAVALNPPPQPEAPPPPPKREPQKVTVPAGTSLTVRLGEPLTTERSQPGDTFTATLDQPLIIDGMAIAERGSRVEGRVVEAERAGRVKGVASLALQLVRLHTSDGQNVALTTESFRKEGVASRGDDIKKVGVGAAIGAAIGAIAGGGKGAAIGAGVGGAAGTGTVMATRGKDVELPVETRITFRLQQPLSLTEKLN